MASSVASMHNRIHPKMGNKASKDKTVNKVSNLKTVSISKVNRGSKGSEANLEIRDSKGSRGKKANLDNRISQAKVVMRSLLNK